MNWYLDVLKKYVVLSGRARRKEYWMFTLINSIIGIILMIIERSTGLVGDESTYGILTSIYLLATLLPALGVSARRLHDIGRTAWWLLIGFVPLIGFIVLIIFYVKDSDPGDNEYGPNPKGE